MASVSDRTYEPQGGAGEVGVFYGKFRMGGSGPSEREHAAMITQ